MRWSTLLLGAVLAWSTVRASESELPNYVPEHSVAGPLTSIGDDTLGPLVADWLVGFQKLQPAITRGPRWSHPGSDAAFGALMFETADVAPLAREPRPTELAPYAHQFKGDMMKEPVLIRVAWSNGDPATPRHPFYLAVNQRPGAPLPQKTKEFLRFVLSRDGQSLIGRRAGFAPLSAAEVATEIAKLGGYFAPVDPAIAPYRPTVAVEGPISNVGSDGMESLMEKWMTAFCRIHPGVHRGARWSHQGTLNGFHALLAGETDIAAMGRELWPSESASYQQVRGQAAPLEIRVARGGFNTPQRTTAQAIFVHPSNPLAGLTLGQIATIFGAEPRAGTKPITHWGQLGLTGEWAQRPLHIYVPPRVSPNAMSMQLSVLHGGPWSAAVREAPVADLAAAIARDPDAIGFGGFEDGAAGLRTLPVAATAAGPFIVGDAATAANGTYPLTRYLYIRVNQVPGRPLPPQVREFLRFVLSRDAQEFIPTSAYYPLRADEISAELARIDALR